MEYLNHEEKEKLINYCIRKFNLNSNSLEYQDLMQEGHIAIMKAEKMYKPDLGAAFNTFAVYYIRKAIIKALEGDFKQQQIINKNTVENQEDSTDLDTEEGAFKAELLDYVESLPETERFVIQEMFVGKRAKRLVDVARKMGTSKQRVFQIKERAISMLRESMGDAK